jgi:hypothetical protein
MWSSWSKEKGTTHVTYIANLKDGPKRDKKTFSMILERVFLMVWCRGRKSDHIKNDFLMLRCLSPPKMLTSPLFEETLGAFFALSLVDLGVLMIFEEKITSSKTYFQMASIY